MGGALAEVAIAMKVMPKNTISVGVGLIAVGAALEIVANALGKMGGMTWEEIAKGACYNGRRSCRACPRSECDERYFAWLCRHAGSGWRIGYSDSGAAGSWLNELGEHCQRGL